ncbi:penicillin-binding protein, beta-lactamase class C [Rhizobium leguminosarum bv. trifolii WSM2012]|nr:penicillin-binding protein, beta-lactamase class C [Rhizobium leguminosarum bv. trifolii WSM2012]
MTSISPSGAPAVPVNSVIPPADWDRAPLNRWSFQHVSELLRTTPVRRGEGPASLLPTDLQDIDAITFAADGQVHTIGSFLETNYTDGLLILHGGKIVAERYLNSMTPQTQHLSQSVAKSVVGTVAGILIGRGVVDPSATLTHYLPELEATAYRGATVQHVLDMTSGVVFVEAYTANDSHMAQLDVASGWEAAPGPDLANECLEPGPVFEGSGVSARSLFPLSLDGNGCIVLRSRARRRYQTCRARQPGIVGADGGGRRRLFHSRLCRLCLGRRRLQCDTSRLCSFCSAASSRRRDRRPAYRSSRVDCRDTVWC